MVLLKLMPDLAGFEKIIDTVTVAPGAMEAVFAGMYGTPFNWPLALSRVTPAGRLAKVT